MADVWKGTLSRPESKNPRELAFRCVKGKRPSASGSSSSNVPLTRSSLSR